MAYTIQDYLHDIDDFVKKPISYHPEEYFAIEGKHYIKELLDGARINVSLAEKETAIIMVHYVLMIVKSMERVLSGTGFFRDVIESILGIGYFDEINLNYGFFRNERLRNFVLGKLCTDYAIRIQNVDVDNFDEKLFRLVMDRLRQETVIQVSTLIKKRK